MKKIIRFLFAPIGGALGYWAWKLLVMILGTGNITLFGWADITIEIALISVMTLIGYFVGRPAADAIHNGMTHLTKNAKEMPAKDLLLAVVGLLVGFLAAFLISSIFRGISNEILVLGINALIYVICGTLGVRIALLRRNDVKLPGQPAPAQGGTLLDTSILIDGRACDLLKSGFLPAPVVLPKFVLEEVTHLADSEDAKKRTRGRLGLDEAVKLQEQGALISDEDYKDLSSREEKLIRLAREKNASILT
ncbi:MAG: hypothetical protein J6X30_05785, partial [Clostridia bacterium]|nr:hypothetical protein [Clostridia bacterium]